jgi:hypothetical protein
MPKGVIGSHKSKTGRQWPIEIGKMINSGLIKTTQKTED